MITNNEINLGAQYFAPGQIWWFDLTSYEYKSDGNIHTRRPFLIISSIGRRVYAAPISHGNVNGSNFRFSIPYISADNPDDTPDISYVCMDNIRQIRIDSYVADGGTYTYAGVLTPTVMQKLLAGFIASVLFNNYGVEYVDAAFDMAIDMLDKRKDYAITGFTPCVVHGDAELCSSGDEALPFYKKDYRMISAINTQRKKHVVTDIINDESVQKEETDKAETSQSTENTNKKSYKRYDIASAERGMINLPSGELREAFAKSMIEPDEAGSMTIIELQQEFARVTGSNINATPAANILLEVSSGMNLGKDNEGAFCVSLKRDIFKNLIRRCPPDKMDKKKQYLKEIQDDITKYGKEISGLKWGYSPKYLASFLETHLKDQRV